MIASFEFPVALVQTLRQLSII